MIAIAMVQTLVLGVLVTVAALAAEHALRLLRLAARGVWLLALIVTVTVTAGIVWRAASVNQAPAAPTAVDARSAISAGGDAGMGRLRTNTTAESHWTALQFNIDVSALPDGIDRSLLTVWAVMTLVMLSMIGVSARGMSRIVRNARATELHGIAVRLTDSHGPAVVGVRNPSILIPGWLPSLNVDRQRLVLHHEQEHARAYDPACLMAAALLVAFVPWHLCGWYMYRRLQRAVEIDCDRRVLSARVDVREYATLLLDLGTSRSDELSPAWNRGRRGSMVRARVLEMVRRNPPHVVPRVFANATLVAMTFLAAFLVSATRVIRSAQAQEPAAAPAAAIRADEINAMLVQLLHRYHPDIARNETSVPPGGVIVGFALAGKDSVVSTTITPLHGRATLEQRATIAELFPAMTARQVSGGLTSFLRDGRSPGERRVVIAWTSTIPL